MGRIMLEADLQLKKDTASLTSPQNPEGKEYWDKLYKKAGELFGTENITIPTITRPWIVPGEVIIRESEDSAYIYKANLKVMLEEDHLTGRGGSRTAPTYQQYTFSDPRMKELNRYSTQLIKEFILPKLTQEVNTSKKYAQLRQVFFSLILSRWFKDRFKGLSAGNGLKPFPTIDSGDLTNLTSKDPWSKDYYFNEYKKSFQQGEYNLKEQVPTSTGQVIRSYVSGGADMTEDYKTFVEGGFRSVGTSSPIDWQTVVRTAALISAGIAGLGAANVLYKFIKKGVVPTVDYIRKFKIIEAGINAALGYADKDMLSADDAILLHKRFKNYQDRGVEEVIEIIEGTIKLLEQPYPKPRNKIERENRERVIAILEESLKAAGSSPLTQKEAKKGFNKSFGNLDRNYGDNSSADRGVKTYWKQMYPQYLPFVNYIVDNEQDLRVMESKINELAQSIETVRKEGLSVKFITDLNEFLGNFKVWRDAAAQELSLQKTAVSSSLTQDLPQNTDSPLTPGGIDFTQINYLTRPMGSFQGLDLRLPILSKTELEGIDINQELASVEQMINAGIDVSTDRLKRLLAAMSQKDAFTSQRETQLLPLLLRLCWLKEEKGSETTPDFRAVLLIADTGLFVEQGNTKHSLN